MGGTSKNAYQEAFESAKIRLDQLIDEFESLKSRQTALANAIKALETMIIARGKARLERTEICGWEELASVTPL